MITDILKQTEQKMGKTASVLKSSLSRIRTGRAYPELLDHIAVTYYSSPVPLNQVCSITVEEATVLALSVWEKSMTAVVEKAIRSSDLGLNPIINGNIIRVTFPPLTEERRKDMVKLVHKQSENAKVAVRNIRRDANQYLKKTVKEKKISEDEEKEASEAIQKITDQHIQRIDAMLAGKEKDLMSI